LFTSIISWIPPIFSRLSAKTGWHREKLEVFYFIVGLTEVNEQAQKLLRWYLLQLKDLARIFCR